MKRFDLDLKNALAIHEYREGGKKRIMVVDDNPSFLMFMRSVLRMNNASLQALDNPLDAIKCFIDCRPDFVFLDVNMPGLDGLKLFGMLQQVNIFDSKILLLSANAMNKRIAREENLGQIDFLRKPISPETLRKIVFGKDYDMAKAA